MSKSTNIEKISIPPHSVSDFLTEMKNYYDDVNTSLDIFHAFGGPKSIFSNFHDANFTICYAPEGDLSTHDSLLMISFSCGEQAMMCSKALAFRDYVSFIKILLADSPPTMKRFGRSVAKQFGGLFYPSANNTSGGNTSGGNTSGGNTSGGNTSEEQPVPFDLIWYSDEGILRYIYNCISARMLTLQSDITEKRFYAECSTETNDDKIWAFGLLADSKREMKRGGRGGRGGRGRARPNEERSVNEVVGDFLTGGTSLASAVVELNGLNYLGSFITMAMNDIIDGSICGNLIYFEDRSWHIQALPSDVYHSLYNLALWINGMSKEFSLDPGPVLPTNFLLKDDYHEQCNEIINIVSKIKGELPITINLYDVSGEEYTISNVHPPSRNYAYVTKTKKVAKKEQKFPEETGDAEIISQAALLAEAEMPYENDVFPPEKTIYRDLEAKNGGVGYEDLHDEPIGQSLSRLCNKCGGQLSIKTLGEHRSGDEAREIIIVCEGCTRK